MLAGAGLGDINNLVLWNPVVSIEDHVEELTATYQWRLRRSGVTLQETTYQQHTEILGYLFPNLLLQDLKDCDLLGVQRPPAQRILVIEGENRSQGTILARHLEKIVPRVEHQQVPGPSVWRDDERALVPIQTIRAVVSWISEES